MKLFISATEYIDTAEPLDISLELSNTEQNPRAWYVNPPVFKPVRTEHYVGSVEEGGSVNFRDIFFNPHGHGTHTECLGHITKEVYSVNSTLKEYFFRAQVISVSPEEYLNYSDGKTDKCIMPNQLASLSDDVEVLVIRTLPNSEDKKSKNYSNSNPPYLHVDCASVLLKNGIKHLMVDVPSVDRENDEGKLAFHHAFWEVPQNENHERTITELIYVEDAIPDGIYILNIQMASFRNDAAPSRPVLYQIKKS